MDSCRDFPRSQPGPAGVRRPPLTGPAPTSICAAFHGDPRQGAETPLGPGLRAARKSIEPDPVRTGVGNGTGPASSHPPVPSPLVHRCGVSGFGGPAQGEWMPWRACPSCSTASGLCPGPSPVAAPAVPPRVDVAVVGGGVIGLSVGWRLARRGLSVAVFDAGAAGAARAPPPPACWRPKPSTSPAAIRCWRSAWKAWRCGRPSATSSKPTPAPPSTTGRRARWWWRSAATRSTACAPATPCSAGPGSTPAGWARPRCATSSPACAPTWRAASSAPATTRSTRASRSRRCARPSWRAAASLVEGAAVERLDLSGGTAAGRRGRTAGSAAPPRP